VDSCLLIEQRFCIHGPSAFIGCDCLDLLAGVAVRRNNVLSALFRDVFVCVFSPDTADPRAGETSLSGRELSIRDPLVSRFTQPFVASAAQSSSEAVPIWIAG
jgi:hypothetical protein